MQTKARLNGGSEIGLQEVDDDQAVFAALTAFEDGMYLVVIDEVEHKKLDQQVYLTPDKPYHLHTSHLANWRLIRRTSEYSFHSQSTSLERNMAKLEAIEKQLSQWKIPNDFDDENETSDLQRRIVPVFRKNAKEPEVHRVRPF